MKNILSKLLVLLLMFSMEISAKELKSLEEQRKDAQLDKAKLTIKLIANGLSIERQKRLLQGNFGMITALTSDNTKVFDTFRAKNGKGIEVDTGHNVLNFSVKSSTDKYKWEYKPSTKEYIYHGENNISFTIENGKFVCDTSRTGCQILTAYDDVQK